MSDIYSQITQEFSEIKESEQVTETSSVSTEKPLVSPLSVTITPSKESKAETSNLGESKLISKIAIGTGVSVASVFAILFISGAAQSVLKGVYDKKSGFIANLLEPFALMGSLSHRKSKKYRWFKARKISGGVNYSYHFVDLHELWNYLHLHGLLMQGDCPIQIDDYDCAAQFTIKIDMDADEYVLISCDDIPGSSTQSFEFLNLTTLKPKIFNMPTSTQLFMHKAGK